MIDPTQAVWYGTAVIASLLVLVLYYTAGKKILDFFDWLRSVAY
ncbi:hypothetical protein [Halobacterium sp. GSL-19]|nr:hypothetical protein [Halobacterium sp. GSL-19]